MPLIYTCQTPLYSFKAKAAPMLQAALSLLPKRVATCVEYSMNYTLRSGTLKREFVDKLKDRIPMGAKAIWNNGTIIVHHLKEYALGVVPLDKIIRDPEQCAMVPLEVCHQLTSGIQECVKHDLMMELTVENVYGTLVSLGESAHLADMWRYENRHLYMAGLGVGMVLLLGGVAFSNYKRAKAYGLLPLRPDDELIETELPTKKTEVN